MGTRETILQAAAQVVRSQGLAKATTKEIAKAAGFSEATLYKHFADKEEIFVEVLRAQVPSFAPLIRDLIDHAGQGTVRDGLLTAARAALAFYRESVLMLASTFSEPRLLARHRAALTRKNLGPHRAIDGLAEYLAAEQRLGRIDRDADPRAAAALLLGACFHEAFLNHFAGHPRDPSDAESFAVAIVETVLRAVASHTPRDSPTAEAGAARKVREARSRPRRGGG